MKPGELRLKQFIATVIAAAALGACLLQARRGRSADAEANPECAGAGKPESRYMGADSCSLCHAKGNAAGTASELATLDEFATWDHRDRHRLAFDALSTPRARQMEALLDMKPGEAATSRQCIACHAIDVTADSAGPTLPDAISQHAAVAQGVGCEACHGRASLWIDRHWKKGEWSGLQPPLSDQKYDQYGMTNLRDPVRRTELCLSCHLGDIACGKFVTHDMFAAGHPPLPAFEVESFLEQMPPHWRQAPPLSRTRSVALEGLVALRASVRLLADASRLPQHAGHTDLVPGDFAIYDCTACHHELQIPSQRQERGYFGGAPGRPSMRGWNIPLAMAAIEPQSSKGGTSSPSPLDASLARLQSATRSRPFGDPLAVQTTARELIAQLDETIANVQSAPPDIKEPQRLVEQICRAGGKLPLEYEMAWQLVGALRALVADMEHSGSGEAPTPVDPKIKSLVEELSALVHYPSAPEVSNSTRSAGNGSLWQDGTDFNSEQFRDKLGEIVRLLGSH